jgi:hypothetical protein
MAFMQNSRMKNSFSTSYVYIDDILLTSSDVNLPLEKNFLSSSFNTIDLGEASFVLGIGSHRNRRQGVLGLSQRHT